MIKKGIIKNARFFILFTILFLSIGIKSTFAAPPPLSAKFSFTINSDSFEKGDWRLYFVPITNYGFNNEEDAKDYFHNLEEKYVKIKGKCGLSSNFGYTILEENHGRLESKNDECDSYLKYVDDPVTDNPTISFHKFHYVYLAKNKPNENTIHNYPIDCKIFDNNCEINVSKQYESKSPYFIVLEKLNSNNDIYFSEPITINWEDLTLVEWESFESNIYNLNINQLELSSLNDLVVNIESTIESKIIDDELGNKLKGKIILRVEQNGEAYYINPKDQSMHFLGRPAEAFNIMRSQGIGITNSDLNKIPIGLSSLSGQDSDNDGLSDIFEDAIGIDKNNPDTDGDGYSDKEELEGNYNPRGQGSLEINNDFANKQKGKILLQVEGNGEAWYVNSEDGKRYFLGRPADAFQVMRNLGLGISNEDFRKLAVADSDQDNFASSGGCQAFPDKLETCEPFVCEFDHFMNGHKMQREIKGLEDGKCVYLEEMPNGGEMECSYTQDYYQAVAQYYKDVGMVGSIGNQIENGEITYTLDGKEVQNPLQEAMNQGQCVVSGY